MKNNHFLSPKKRKKSLPEKVLKSLPVKINEKQSLLVTKNEEKINSTKSFTITSGRKKKRQKITSVHQKRGKNHFQKKFENISGEKQWKILTSDHQKEEKITSWKTMKNNHCWSPKKRKKSLPEKVWKSLPVKNEHER